MFFALEQPWIWFLFFLLNPPYLCDQMALFNSHLLSIIWSTTIEKGVVAGPGHQVWNLISLLPLGSDHKDWDIMHILVKMLSRFFGELHYSEWWFREAYPSTSNHCFQCHLCARWLKQRFRIMWKEIWRAMSQSPSCPLCHVEFQSILNPLKGTKYPPQASSQLFCLEGPCSGTLES